MSPSGPSTPVFCSGATGYIGSAILRRLGEAGVPVLAGVRRRESLPMAAAVAVTGDLAEPGLHLPAVSAVIHAAGLGHRRGVGARTWRRENVDAAVNLARAARAAGAEKFILISTAHVHGRVHAGIVTDSTPPNPMDSYASSKLQAEHEVAAAFGAGFSVIRPVAVIGPNCPGNVFLLMKLLRRGVPLPFAGIENRRSFILREDLAEIVLAVLRSAQPPESVLAAHPESISTPELIRALAEGLGISPRLFACRREILGVGAAMFGRAAMWQSTAGDFVANPLAARALGWVPGQNLVESFRFMARYHSTVGAHA